MLTAFPWQIPNKIMSTTLEQCSMSFSLFQVVQISFFADGVVIVAPK